MSEEKEKSLEPAETNAYMEAELNGERPSDADRLKYLRTRYEQVKEDYKTLRFQKEEAERGRNDELLNRLTVMFRTNFASRKFIVTELRKMGQDVKDQFIPSSA